MSNNEQKDLLLDEDDGSCGLIDAWPGWTVHLVVQGTGLIGLDPFGERLDGVDDLR
jgi:hypothetical protein